jgi:hypothetical protein
MAELEHKNSTVQSSLEWPGHRESMYSREGELPWQEVAAGQLRGARRCKLAQLERKGEAELCAR